MPRYYFDLVDGDVLAVDEEGLELKDLGAVWEDPRRKLGRAVAILPSRAAPSLQVLGQYDLVRFVRACQYFSGFTVLPSVARCWASLYATPIYEKKIDLDQRWKGVVRGKDSVYGKASFFVKFYGFSQTRLVLVQRSNCHFGL